MGKKLTYEHVKTKFEEEGYELLSTEYLGCEEKLYYKCTQGHTHSITWHDFNSGYRCPYCYGNIKYTYLHVKNEFEKFGYVLLSDEYKNVDSKLIYICPNRHKGSISFYHFNKGTRCSKCMAIGENNSNWKGGISYEPYCPVWSDKEYKINIKERDGNLCQNPYCFKTDNKLHIHHIDYDKKNCHPSNLITICCSCNVRANYSRKWHTEWYQTIMNKKYKYNY